MSINENKFPLEMYREQRIIPAYFKNHHKFKIQS